jgi:hypothetical protein
MKLKLELSPDVEARLRERATLTGRSPENLTLEALEEELSADVETEEVFSATSRPAEFQDWLASHPTSEAANLDDSRHGGRSAGGYGA